MSEAEFLRKVLLNVFKDHGGQSAEAVVARVEARIGLSLAQVDASNAEVFLQAVKEELSALLGNEWKASFVTTVVKNVLIKCGILNG